MSTTSIAALRQSLTAAPSRRGVLTGLAGVLLATGTVNVAEDAEAKKRKRRNKRKNRNKKKNEKPKTRLDANCSGAGEEEAAHTAGEVRVAQNFTAIRSGELVKATIPVTSELDTETNFVLHVSPLDREGVPTDEVLAEATDRIGRAPAAVDVLEFNFSFPFSVEAGVDYALVLSRPTGFEFIWRADLDNLCGGRVFVSRNPEEPFQEFSGVVDLLFETFVRS